MKNKLEQMARLLKSRPPIKISALETPADSKAAPEGTVTVKNKAPYVTDSSMHVNNADQYMGASTTAPGADSKTEHPYGAAALGRQGGVAHVDTQRIQQDKNIHPERVQGVAQHEAQHQLFDQYVGAGNFKTPSDDIGDKHAHLATAVIHKAGLDQREWALMYHVAAAKGYDPHKEPDEAISNLVEAMNSGYDERYKMYQAGKKKLPLPEHESFANYVHGLKHVYSKLREAAGSFEAGKPIQGVEPGTLDSKYGSDWGAISKYDAVKYNFRVNKLKPKDNVRMAQQMQSAEQRKHAAGGFAGYARKDEKLKNGK